MNFALPGQRRNTTMTYLYRDLMLVVLVFLLGTSCYFALTLSVALDGSQPFSSIQSAVQASAHGDTVLVYPGRYLENVDYIGKNITIASLELITGNPAYRDSTIIDGNRNGSVIKSITEIDQAGIYGFAIVNGTGTPEMYYQGIQLELGGGLLILNALDFQIDNCTIICNNAYWGGGIYLRNSILYISSSTIHGNFASDGGGLFITGMSRAFFDPMNRCSIYDNTSGSVQDIVASDARLFSSIYLDMGTLCPTTDYYIQFRKSTPDQPGGFSVVDVQRGFRTEVNHDIYVSPSGENANDGLSADTPLKTICRAMQMIVSDSLNPKTVHLASGVYSSDDGQFFPIAIKPYVTLLGDSVSHPIIRVQLNRCAIIGHSLSNTTVENLSIDYQDNPTGGVAITMGLSKDVLLKNIMLSPNQSVTYSGINLGSNGYFRADFSLDNVSIVGHTSPYSTGLLVNMADVNIDGLTINDCHVTGGESSTIQPILYSYGDRIVMNKLKLINNSKVDSYYPLISIGVRHLDSDSRLIMSNVLVANNQSGGASPVSISAFTDSTSLISNCTFANNRGSYFAATLKGNLQVSNCIFDNDTPAEILIENTQPNFTSTISFNNNFIRGYPQSFSSVAANQISFNDVVLTGDPGFCDLEADDPLSYRLGNSSMLRDAGTPDTTGLHLPAYDYYGNPRIYNGIIDIGCSEWNYPLANSDEYQAPPASLQVYPNPFSSEAKISFSLEKAARVQLKIFNLRGQLLRTISQPSLTKGEHSLAWNGRDDQDYRLASGIYLLQLYLEGKAHSIRKVLKL